MNPGGVAEFFTALYALLIAIYLRLHHLHKRSLFLEIAECVTVAVSVIYLIKFLW